MAIISKRAVIEKLLNGVGGLSPAERAAAAAAVDANYGLMDGFILSPNRAGLGTARDFVLDLKKQLGKRPAAPAVQDFSVIGNRPMAIGVKELERLSPEEKISYANACAWQRLQK